MSVGPDIGRDYQDPPSAEPRLSLRPLPRSDWSDCATEFTVHYKGETLVQPVWYAHLALLKLLKHHEFKSVLELGSNDGMVAKLFKFLDKDVVALEPCIPCQNSPEQQIYPPDYEVDFLEARFPKKFDAIWCSHVLEHIRNPGMFLDKVYDDLKEGGTLAITVPFNDMGTSLTNLVIGHHSKYNHLLLVYQLVCAGFDCRHASVAIYQGQISVVVKKVPNNVVRSNAALYCPYPPGSNFRTVDGRWNEPRLYDFFPFPFAATVAENANAFFNWNPPL